MSAVATTFSDRLTTAMRERKSLVCVGLDPDPSRFPSPLASAPSEREAIVEFNRAIIAATSDLVCAYKPNLGFYLARGVPGLRALEATRALVPSDVPVILDAKIGDVGSTAEAYARGVLDVWGFDAVTVNPYLGHDAMEPFLAAPDRGVFVLCRTSNPSAGDLQDLLVGNGDGAGVREPLYLKMADTIATWAGSAAADVGLVVGATYPRELAVIRERCPTLPILLPGVGAQGGDLGAAVLAGVDPSGEGLIVSASRSVLYAGSGSDYAERARDATQALRDAVNWARNQGRPPAP